ncbi:hypothetical protein GCM10011331_23930 [Flavimobilis marinus]|nr:hypothetical protein GCM10011331_23930 [Flavimobilis marinus]
MCGRDQAGRAYLSARADPNAPANPCRCGPNRVKSAPTSKPATGPNLRPRNPLTSPGVTSADPPRSLSRNPPFSALTPVS